MEYGHYSVLLHEAINQLNINPNGVYVDCTLGGGGHSSLILSKLEKGHLYCFDQDDYAISKAKERLDKISSNYTIIKSNFKYIKEELQKLGVSHIDGVIYDLGVSSFQLDIPQRGFSYRYDAPLDMRMDQTKELTAKKIVNEYSFQELCNIFFRYGEEQFSKQIARKIEEYRKNNVINTTFELVDIIKSALPQKVLNKKGHPAKQVFQALRIAVNDELRVFEDSINDALLMLNKGGRAVVITFHSLEDRLCKTVFKEKSTLNIPDGLPIVINTLPPFSLVTKKPILPSEEEILENQRSHSAKMRVIEKN
ncbi:MAG: 16S rRNA (cytosine(1402)-N(4))-methyltransferase RsmH [Anaeroplasmataceae bacterium]